MTLLGDGHVIKQVAAVTAATAHIAAAALIGPLHLPRGVYVHFCLIHSSLGTLGSDLQTACLSVQPLLQIPQS